MKRWNVINALLDRCDERRFLEIGVGSGQTARQVRADEKWGVDPRSDSPEEPYDYLVRTESDYFFGRLYSGRLFDVVFIDGLHHAKQVYRDVCNALNHLAAGGIIVMHDCNPQSETAQAVPRQQSEWNGDCWKAVVKLRAEHPELDVFTIDTDQGLGVVRQVPSDSIDVDGEPFDLTWSDLVQDRERLLGLISPSEWEQRL